MKIIIKWKLEKNCQIVALAVDPVHDQVLIGVEKTIVIFDSIKGSEIASCERHTSDITCLSVRKDGLFFASGGKDNIVYIWDFSNLSKPVSKITYNDFPLQVVYNPCILTVSIILILILAYYT